MKWFSTKYVNFSLLKKKMVYRKDSNGFINICIVFLSKLTPMKFMTLMSIIEMAYNRDRKLICSCYY